MTYETIEKMKDWKLLQEETAGYLENEQIK